MSKLEDVALRSGTLTAEQVEEAINNHCQFTVGCIVNAQAIADELNSLLGNGTCKCVTEYAKSPIDGKTIVLHRCSACHELMRPFMNYCPNCGAMVVDR